MSQEPDQVIAAKYRLVRRLARGGMGAVWLARHVELDTDVALKFIRQEEGSDPQVEARFRREARAAAQLKSPHVVHIHDFGVDHDVPYLAMELLQGEDLEERLAAQGALTVDESLKLFQQAAKGVRAAHEAGIVHRDLKPSNLFLSQMGGEQIVKVLDFGIARGGSGDDGETTTQGLVFGSPAFMSPEQARGGKVDPRSDLWSLAAVLFKLLTGKSPFEGSNPSDIVVRICTEDAVPPSALVPELGQEVDGFFRRALHRDPERRFQSVDELVGACSTWSRDARAPDVAQALPPRGRLDETAPLDVPDEVKSSPRPSLRTSVAPERQPPSTARGRWAIRALLLVLGLGGTWLVHFARGEDGSSQSNVSPSRESDGAVRDESLEVEAETRDSTKAPKPREPVSDQDMSTGSEELHLKGETLTPRQKAPVGQAFSEPGKPPQRARPSSQTSRPSPVRRPPVERPSTDPVFGIPVESP